MTLIPYDPGRLDELSLRIFDMAAVFRDLAQRCRRQGISDLAIHDKKAMEWLGKLEYWAHESAQKMSMAEIQHRGARRAAEVQDQA